MIAPARLAAYRALAAVSAGRADLSDALVTARGALHDDRDRALAAEIAIGVQRWRASLDYLIAHFAKRPIGRLDPEIVEILRLSAYQLLHLTRVPAAAVVDDAVMLAKRTGKQSAGGLVNAVLRTLSRSRHALPWPSRPRELSDSNRSAAIEYLSVTLSHPRWLVERWLHRYGFEATEQWLRFNNAAAPLTLRANRFRNTPEELGDRLRAEDVQVERARLAPDGVVVTSGHPLRGEGVAAGWFVVQDEASQLVALLAGRIPGRRVLDTCASPGGKTTALAVVMPGDSLLVACDVRPRRMGVLRRTVAASGAPNVRIVQADLTRPLPFPRTFDCVLVDAPCSGLGTLRRDPDIRWRRQEADLGPLAAAQSVMLAHAADVVVPGGRLVYATCSSEPDENELVAAGFLRSVREFVLEDLRTAAPHLPPAVIDADGYFRTLPPTHGLEAFFGAVFVRRR
jgi:16S rRNA (cytosine967-C5)-methyltransferase